MKKDIFGALSLRDLFISYYVITGNDAAHVEFPELVEAVVLAVARYDRRAAWVIDVECAAFGQYTRAATLTREEQEEDACLGFGNPECDCTACSRHWAEQDARAFENHYGTAHVGDDLDLLVEDLASYNRASMAGAERCPGCRNGCWECAVEEDMPF